MIINFHSAIRLKSTVPSPYNEDRNIVWGGRIATIETTTIQIKSRREKKVNL